MPELDGVTVLKQIRRVDLKQPVVILTGDSTPATERQVRALGVSEFILKGSSLHVLANTLKRLLKTPTPRQMVRTLYMPVIRYSAECYIGLARYFNSGDDFRTTSRKWVVNRSMIFFERRRHAKAWN